MPRREIGTRWDRENRNNINENFRELYDVQDRAIKEATQSIIDSAKLIWLEPVDTFADIATTYQNPEIGHTVFVRDTGKVYRFYDGSWMEIQQIDAGPVNEVETRLSAEIDENKQEIEQARTKADGTTFPVLRDRLNDVDAQLADITLNVKTFGAIGDNISDDTQAILDAIAECPLGGTVLIPAGSFRTTASIVINKNINFIMQGYINSDHTDVAIDINGVGTDNVYIPEFRLKANRSTVDHSEGSIGIRIKNTYHCRIRIDYVSGFTTNIQLAADSGKGTVYNDISLGQVYNGKTQIHITSDGTSGGWSNQNTFIAGRLYYPNTGDRTDYVQIRIDGDIGNSPLYRNNGNTFIGTSLEDVGSSGQYAKAVICNGIFNNFIGIRTEGSMKWEFGSMSYRNFVNGGTYIYMDNITDNGTFNTFLTQGTGGKFQTQTTSSYRFVAGAENSTGAEFTGHGANRIPAKFWNSGSAGNPSFQVMDIDGVTPKVTVRANGIWDVNGTRKILFGIYQNAPTSGDYKRGDISFVPYPSKGEIIGYVCVADGNPGTWEPFGQISVMTSISSVPKFVGQIAVVSGIAYIAVGTSSTADWKQITN